MSEPRIGEVTPTPENLEDQYYAEFIAADDDEKRIGKEINAVVASTPDKAEAHKIIMETLVPQMEAAMAKSRLAGDNWFAEIKKL